MVWWNKKKSKWTSFSCNSNEHHKHLISHTNRLLVGMDTHFRIQIDRPREPGTHRKRLTARCRTGTSSLLPDGNFHQLFSPSCALPLFCLFVQYFDSSSCVYCFAHALGKGMPDLCSFVAIWNNFGMKLFNNLTIFITHSAKRLYGVHKLNLINVIRSKNIH